MSMDRCKVCNREYDLNFLSHFPDEHYCHGCEQEILDCIKEMEERDEEKEDEDKEC